MRHSLRHLAALAACLFLAGCFVSETPLITPDQADYPVELPAHYLVYKLDENGKRTDRAPREASVTREKADYLYKVGNSPETSGIAEAVGNGDYIVQTHSVTKPGVNIYGLIRKTKTGWLRWSPNCSDFVRTLKKDGKTLQDFNISRKGNDCTFANYDALKRAMKAYIAYAAPDTEYVKE